MSGIPEVKVFRSATCQDLLRLAMESARKLEPVSGDSVRYDADSRVLKLTEDPTYLDVRSGEAGRKLGGEEPVMITFNDPALDREVLLPGQNRARLGAGRAADRGAQQGVRTQG
ncbi:hypothetical protein [Methanopyrus sp.]